MDNNEDEKHGLIIFGRDISKIPCARNTLLYSISSYFGVGLLTFLYTSKPTFSSHVGFASFVLVSFGYYIDCNIKYSRQKFQYGQLQQAYRQVVTKEGTADDLRNKPDLKEV